MSTRLQPKPNQVMSQWNSNPFGCVVSVNIIILYLQNLFLQNHSIIEETPLELIMPDFENIMIWQESKTTGVKCKLFYQLTWMTWRWVTNVLRYSQQFSERAMAITTWSWLDNAMISENSYRLSTCPVQACAWKCTCTLNQCRLVTLTHYLSYIDKHFSERPIPKSDLVLLHRRQSPC